MTRLVKDLLILSKLDHGKNQLRREQFNLSRLLADVVKKMTISANAKNLTLTYEPTNEISAFMGDKDRIEQVITNIISNAIKYTPNGGKINIKAGKLYGDLLVEIKDNGIGIPKEDRNRIFERFYRVDKARSRESGGTGLGLSIALEIIHQHGGHIGLVDKEGPGLRVRIELLTEGPSHV